jgi:PAS domain S-box-containing protein
MNLASLPTRNRPLAPGWRMIQSIIDGSLDSMVMVDTRLNISLFNEAYQASYHDFCEQPPAIGQSLYDLYPHHPGFCLRLVCYFERALCGESFQAEELIDDAGRLTALRFRFSPVSDQSGETAGASCFMQDRTEQYLASLLARDQAQYYRDIAHSNQVLSTHLQESTAVLEEAGKALKYSDQRFKGIFECTLTGIGLFDSSGKILETNPALQQILGYSREELARIPLGALTHTNSTNKDFILFEDLLSGKLDSYQTEKQFVRSDGKLIWGLMNVSLLQDMEENELYIISTIQDITSRKLLERTLYMKNVELEKTNNHLDNFVYAIAHDLRSPIANLKQISELLLMKPSAKDPLFEKLKITVDRLDRTASGLIKIIDAQKSDDNQIRAISFSEKMKMIEEELENIILESRACIEQKFEVDGIVYIEPYLESIMRNLIQNALKYAHPNRVPNIRITSYRESAYVVFSVQDNGIGINLKKVGLRLFRPFKRFTSIASGHGIGLHLVKSMVEKNNGSIRVFSKPGKGTTFQVYLNPYDLSYDREGLPMINYSQ